MAFYCLIQSRHEIVHDRWRSERFEAVLDLRVSRMPTPLASSDIDDMHVVQRSLEDVRAKPGASLGEFRQIRFGRHLLRLDKDRQVRHIDSAPASGALLHYHWSIAQPSGHRGVRSSEGDLHQD